MLRQELKVHQRPIFILTLYVRKSEECHRGSESRCSKSFGERYALQGLPEGGGGFTKHDDFAALGERWALQGLPEGVVSPNDFEQLHVPAKCMVGNG